MKIQFLGTAAAEGAPAVFCACDKCRYAREKGGREVRTRSGAMIDDVMKIDFGPDSYAHALQNGLDYSRVHSLFITHTHSDHFQPKEIACRMPPYAHAPENDPPMTVYGNAKVGEKLAPLLNERTLFHPMKAFESVWAEGYKVTALEAVHCVTADPEAGNPVMHEGKTVNRSEETLFYLFEKNGESILYAHDTDEFTPADMEFLAGRKIDIISMDCTNGYLDLDYAGHMGIRENLRMREKLLACGAADEHTIFIANHFSHNGLLPYEEMERRLPGFVVSYDSMIVDTSKSKK